MADSFFYRNNTDFMQPVTIDGKRYVIKSGTIVRVNRELDLDIYSFLEKTDSTPHATELIPLKTKKRIPGATKEAVQDINARVELMQKEMSQLPKRNDILNLLNETLAKTPEIEQAELNQMVEDVQRLKQELEQIAEDTTLDNIVEIQKQHEKSINTVLRRLNIIKKAFQNLESVIYDTITESEDDNEVFVVNDDEEKETGE